MLCAFDTVSSKGHPYRDPHQSAHDGWQSQRGYQLHLRAGVHLPTRPEEVTLSHDQMISPDARACGGLAKGGFVPPRQKSDFHQCAEDLPVDSFKRDSLVIVVLSPTCFLGDSLSGGAVLCKFQAGGGSYVAVTCKNSCRTVDATEGSAAH
eukprot:6461238-Amphidinium_carterae.1